MANIQLQDLIQRGDVWRGQESLFRHHWKSSPFTSIVPNNNETTPIDFISPGSIHECSLELNNSTQKNTWYPPLQFIVSIISQTILQQKNNEKNLIIWVGKKCWPSPYLLNTFLNTEGSCSWINSCLFIDAQNRNQRLLATIQNLRAKSVLAVVTDGSGFNFLDSRKLQLAGQQGSSLGFILKPPWELEQPSTAHTKWLLQPIVTANKCFAWAVSLIKARGLLTSTSWNIELSTNIYEANTLHISSNVVDRPEEKEISQIKTLAA